MGVETKIQLSLVGALAKALPELEGAKKSKANPAFKSKYADLGAVIDALEPITAHGLWFRQHTHESAEGVMVETFYIHDSGEQLSAGSLFMPATKRDAQGFGSALTYARRYGLLTAFGLATEDDDGNAASKGVRDQGAQRGQEPAPQGMPDAELARITNLLRATGVNPVKLCKEYGVENIRLLNQDQFADALNRLNAVLAKMAKEETDRKAADVQTRAAPVSQKSASGFGEILDDEIPF